MAGSDDADTTAPARRARIAAGLALLLLLFILTLWLVRRPVAQHFIDRELARRRVPVRYGIADLGLGRQRLTNVVIGDPARPDLTADWIETDTAVGFSGPRLTGVRAGRVRVRGRIVGGRLSLGSLDRLLPAPSGRAAALPALRVEVADARAAIGTAAGTVLLRLRDGRGRLDDGFAGHLDAAAARLALGACSVEGARIDTRLTTRRGKPTLAGQFAADLVPCDGDVLVQQPGGAFTVTLGEHLDRWQGRATRTGAAVVGAASLAGIDKPYAKIAFAGDARRTAGRFEGTGDALSVDRVGTGRQARYAGRFAVGGSGGQVDGEVQLTGLAIDPARRRRVVAALPRLEGTPVAPLALGLVRAGEAAARRFDLAAAGSLAWGAQGTNWRIGRATLSSASGARLAMTGDVAGGAQGWRGAGRLAIGGGGLPQAAVTVTQSARALTGAATVAPYSAGNARLALAPVSFRVVPEGFDLSTAAALTGPLGEGGVETATMPIEVRSRGGRIAINPGCTPVGWRRVAAGGLVLDPARVSLCATGPALVTAANGRVAGGASLRETRLTGRLGAGPVELRFARATLGTAGGVAEDVAVRLGDSARPVRIEAAQLDGHVGPSGIAGRFEGAAGQVGAVPLLLSGAAGEWRFANGRLSLSGALQVADAASPARFQPLGARGVTLTLADGAIHAAGTLAEPASGTRVAEVTIDHALASGRGEARLDVPGIDFTPAFQPDRLTRLTYGVIADVRGTVSGEARIGWGPDGVTSTGTFRTAGTDLAAAFGPVTGIATEIRFTDLLSLTSAPGQVATVATINPGIAVEDGVVRFQTLPDTRVRVAGGRWPFAGGTLTLEPTLLDFGGTGERRMTFTLAGVAADRFLQQFDFKNLDATGIFDGTLPMVFDAEGGRIERGHLTVRPGGGSLAYLGEVSRRNLGFWGNLAFGALRSLRYRDLSIDMNGPLAGEMITDVRFSGVSQGEGAMSNFLIRRLQRLPFVFNVRIAAPFRGLIDSAQSFYDPKRLIDRNLPALLQHQQDATKAQPSIQPPASGTVP